MNRAAAASLLATVVAGSCVLEYAGERFVSSFPVKRQNQIFVVALGICAVALAFFRSRVAVSDGCVLVVALVAGMLLSRSLGSLGALCAMLMVAATVDTVSTYAGLTRTLIVQAQHGHGEAVLRFLAVSVRLKGQPIAVIGVADLMFFTACVSTLRRLGRPGIQALLAPLAGLLAALGVGLWTGATPALPFLAVGVLLYAGVTRQQTFQSNSASDRRT